MSLRLKITDVEKRTCEVINVKGFPSAVVGDKFQFEGTFPLTDYTDLRKHEYTLTCGEVVITGILDGFTCDCTYATRLRWPNGELGLPEFRLTPSAKEPSTKEKADEVTAESDY